MPEWILAQGEIDGKPVTVRVREDVSAIDPRPYPTLLVLRWPLTAPQPNGLPSPHDHEVLAGLEPLLRATLERDALCVHAFSITHAGAIEYGFYGRDPSEAGARLEALADERAKRLRMSTIADPAWSKHATLVGNCGAP